MKKAILLNFSIPLLLICVSFLSITLFSLNRKGKKDIEDFRKNERLKLQKNLTDLVEIAYHLIEKRYQNSMNDSFLIDYTAKNELGKTWTENEFEQNKAIIRQKILQETLQQLAQVRFDNQEGYFWITDNQLPYPKMVMHPIRPQYQGKTMDDPKFNTEKYHKKNIYQARAELCNQQGSGFIDYEINKPNSTELSTKMSYSKIFPPLGWIISTGLYTDQIEEEILQHQKVISGQMNFIFLITSLIALVVFSCSIFFIYRFSNHITGAINEVKNKLKELSLGQKAGKIAEERKNEIGEMIRSFNALTDGMDAYTSFAREIGQGNLTANFNVLSENDILGRELLQMRNNLKKASIDNAQRNWTSEGITLYNELLRKSATLKEQCDATLSFLAEYAHTELSAIFLRDDEKQLLHLYSCYAYDRKKFVNLSVEPGEGLIGQCFLEKKLTYLKNIPKDHMQVKIGFIEILPSELLILPLIHFGECCGILELAFLEKLDENKINFLENIARNLASAVISGKNSEKTKSLLADSQKMTEELKSIEEELRQNQEEMYATQEELNKQIRELAKENNLMRKELEMKVMSKV